MNKNRKPNRLQGYDYSQDNLYFITSCVHDRICCLGTISNGEMHTNQYGEIMQNQWQWLQTQYPYIILHAFVVMPNHIHGIIEINRDWAYRTVGTGRDLSLPQNGDLSLPDNATATNIKIKSLSQIMGAFKTTTSKQIHLAGLPNFAWQRSFHDHIIRTESSYLNISNYILTNPQKWKDDTFYL